VAVGLVQGLAKLGLEGAFAQADRGGVLGGDALRQGQGFRRPAGRGAQAVHHPKRMGAGGGEEIAGGQKLESGIREPGGGRATAGVEQNRPRLMPLTPKRAVSDATIRSHEQASWHPAAVATPWTRAMTGWGRRGKALHHAGAQVEERLETGAAAVGVLAESLHFLQVMARREDLALGFQG
jgi:hypothetical protein